MMEVFKEKVYKGIIPWIDNLLLYSDTKEGLFSLFEWVLNKAEVFRLKFSPKNLTLITQEIKWCGKLVVPGGIKVDPEKRRFIS